MAELRPYSFGFCNPDDCGKASVGCGLDQAFIDKLSLGIGPRVAGSRPDALTRPSWHLSMLMVVRRAGHIRPRPRPARRESSLPLPAFSTKVGSLVKHLLPRSLPEYSLEDVGVKLTPVRPHSAFRGMYGRRVRFPFVLPRPDQRPAQSDLENSQASLAAVNLQHQPFWCPTRGISGCRISAPTPIRSYSGRSNAGR